MLLTACSHEEVLKAIPSTTTTPITNVSSICNSNSSDVNNLEDQLHLQQQAAVPEDNVSHRGMFIAFCSLLFLSELTICSSRVSELTEIGAQS